MVATYHPEKVCAVCGHTFTAYCRRQVVCCYNCRVVRNAMQCRQREGRVRVAHRYMPIQTA